MVMRRSLSEDRTEKPKEPAALLKHPKTNLFLVAIAAFIVLVSLKEERTTAISAEALSTCESQDHDATGACSRFFDRSRTHAERQELPMKRNRLCYKPTGAKAVKRRGCLAWMLARRMCGLLTYHLGPPVVPFYPCFGGGFPY